MLHLKNAQTHKTIAIQPSWTILDLALKHEMEWGFSCTRGTCARCRCFVEAGTEVLAEPTDAEYARLDDQELEQGYRLACQCAIKHDGEVTVRYEPYK
jgi:2Fe-2S ferredoxin